MKKFKNLLLIFTVLVFAFATYLLFSGDYFLSVINYINTVSLFTIYYVKNKKF